MSENSIRRNDYMWLVLALYGINVCNKPLNKIQKCIAYFKMTNLHLSAIYMTSCFIYMVCIKISFKKGLAYMLATLFSLSLWYSIVVSRKAISRVIQQIYSIRLEFSRNSSDINYYKICPISIFLSPFIFTIILICLSKAFEKPQKNYWTYGYEITNKKLLILCNIIGSYWLFLLLITTPILVTAFMCTLLRRCTQISEEYIMRLRSLLEMDHYTKMNVIENFFTLSQVIENVAKVLYIPTFLLILGNFSMIFTSIESFFSGNINSVSMAYEISLMSASGCVMVLTLTHNCSTMSEKLEIIHNICTKTIDKLTFCSPSDDKMISLLKRMESRDVIYVTACGMVTFNRSLILSAFGALFTYSMLILSMASESKTSNSPITQ